MTVLFHGCFGVLVGLGYAYTMIRPFSTLHRIPGRLMILAVFLLRFAAACGIIWIALHYGFEPLAVLPCVLCGYAACSAIYIRHLRVA